MAEQAKTKARPGAAHSLLTALLKLAGLNERAAPTSADRSKGSKRDVASQPSAQRVLRLPSARESVILEILIHGEKYGLQICDEYLRRTQSEMPLGSLYVTLGRMDAAGFLTSRMGKSESARGGNRRKYWSVSAHGHACLNMRAGVWGASHAAQ